jgi:hypothetical protein
MSRPWFITWGETAKMTSSVKANSGKNRIGNTVAAQKTRAIMKVFIVVWFYLYPYP